MPRAELRVVESEDGLLLPAVRESLEALKADPTHRFSTDKALHRLAETYAGTIDQHTEAVAVASELIKQAENDEVEIAKRTLNAILKFTESVTVLNDLGPRLQSVMETLGASPKARAQMTGSKGGGKPDDAGAGKQREETSLERRRREADERVQRARAHGAAPVDPTSS